MIYDPAYDAKMAQAARLDQKATDLRDCAQRFRTAATALTPVLNKAVELTSGETWRGPYADVATERVLGWRTGLRRSSDAMMVTAARWERAAAGFNNDAADLRREAAVLQRLAGERTRQDARAARTQRPL